MNSLVMVVGSEETPGEEVGVDVVVLAGMWEGNSESGLMDILQHLAVDMREELFTQLWKFLRVFGKSPIQMMQVEHDIDVGDARPVNLLMYQVKPLLAEALRGD